jgi:uncharacterized protein YcbX
VRVGRVKELWRYPVKSMGGERLSTVDVGARGIPGDRGWAVRDEERGGIRGAKKIPSLMRCRARYPVAPTAARTGPAEMTLPDGTTVATDAPDAAARLTAALGRRVTLWPLLPADRLDHYRRGAPTHDDLERELRSIFALEPDEPLPDLSGLPPEVMEFESPPGTYFDAYPLHILTDASLARLQGLAPASAIDVRRFRPNVLVAAEGGADGFLEQGWVGRRLRVGGAVARVAAACPRCVMTTLAQGELPADPRIMRTLVREAGQNLGVYATVEEPGAVAAGDPVTLLA